MKLGRDSVDYDLLEEAVAQVPEGPYLSLEIGVREGGSSQIIMESLAKAGRQDYTHIGVDHYGSMPQAHSDQHTMVLDYDNSMRNRAIPELFRISQETGINFVFYNMDDGEFFHRFEYGVPLYHGSRKTIRKEYGFVFFDGPHATDLVMQEVEFFVPRTTPNGILVFDDTSNFNMGQIGQRLQNAGFDLLRGTNNKQAFKRTRFEG